MVIDTSAVIAILFQEADRDLYVEAIDGAGRRLMSAVNAFESAVVVEARKGPAGGRELDLLLHRAQIDVVPFDVGLMEEARRIWRAFGKGNHPAGLNFYDCCGLALARVSGERLLFKGDDFVRAGVESALVA